MKQMLVWWWQADTSSPKEWGTGRSMNLVGMVIVKDAHMGFREIVPHANVLLLASDCVMDPPTKLAVLAWTYPLPPKNVV